MVSPLSRAGASVLNGAWGLELEVIPALRGAGDGPAGGTHPSDLGGWSPEVLPVLEKRSQALPASQGVSRLKICKSGSCRGLRGCERSKRNSGCRDASMSSWRYSPFQRTAAPATALDIPLHQLGLRWTLGRSPAEDRLSLLNWRPAPFLVLP